MYINARVYEDLYLKNQPIESVEREVEKMRAELKRLKYAMESPVNRDGNYSDLQSEQESINATREYLNCALLYYAELKGDNSVLTEEERVAATLRSLRMYIERATLNMGGYVYVVDVLNGKVTAAKDGVIETERECERSQLIAALADLRIEEWREVYAPEDYGCNLICPEKWTLTVDYGESMESRGYSGEGVYPYNFGALKRLLRIN